MPKFIIKLWNSVFCLIALLALMLMTTKLLILKGFDNCAIIGFVFILTFVFRCDQIVRENF